MSEQRDQAQGPGGAGASESPSATPAPEMTELERVWAEVLKALRELERVSAERDALERRIRASSAWAYQARARARERDSTITELQRKLAEAQESLGRAEAQGRQRAARLERLERLLKQTGIAVKAFQTQLDRDLRQYRSQRAWKVMLLFRKAYTQLVRQGWRQRLQFVRWLLGLGGDRAAGLDAYELHFPDVLAYVPGQLYTLDAGGALAEEAGAEAAPAHGAAPVPPRPRPHSDVDVIVLPVFEFDFRHQRPQHLAEQLARQGHRVFWVSPSRMLPIGGERSYEVLALREKLWEVHLRACQPNIYAGELSPADVQGWTDGLQQLYRDWGLGASCTVVQLPFWRRVALAVREAFGSRIVYDCMDEWSAMPGLGEFTRGEEPELLRECDVLVVTSRGLQEKLQARGAPPLLVPNAADFEFFSQVRPLGRLAHIPKPVVGYFGAIAQWFDYDLLRAVAASRPNYSFVLIGGFGLEDDPRGHQIGALRELPNVYALGHKPYAELPFYLAEFDACIIPFLLNEVIHATDPVKLYEYLSQGKPVVTTAMSELSHYGDMIYLASDAEDFARKLDAALAEPDGERKARRIQFAAQNTWARRAQALERAVRDSFPLVSVVIVTYQSAEYVDPCLDSLRRNTCYPAWEVILVDNGSQDGTADLAAQRAALDPRIQVIRQPHNAGFAAGNNLGVRNARGEYLILLNVDTIVTPGWMEQLIRHTRQDPFVGMVVPVTNSAGNEVKIDVTYTNLPEMEDFALDLARENLGLTLEIRMGPLFCALIPRPVWEKVGELDERFEVGMFEDDDYSHRLARAGYRVVAAEDCFVHHFGQAAFSRLSPSQYQEIFDANRRRYEEKWGFSWIPHQYRPGVRAEGARFTPAEFVGPPAGAARTR